MEKEKIIKATGIENYDELDHYFEISSVDLEEFLLREIRRKIIEKFDAVIDVLNELIYPSTSNIIEIIDANAISGDDREIISDILKAFSFTIKTYKMLELDSSEDEEKEFCKNALEVYKNKLPELKVLIEKTKDAYSKNIKIKENPNYLG